MATTNGSVRLVNQRAGLPVRSETTPDIQLIITAFGLIADYLGISDRAGLARSASTTAAEYAAEQATRYQRAEEGFIRMSRGGALAHETLAAMRQTSEKAIDDTTLMQMANKAVLLGLSWDPNELARLFRLPESKRDFWVKM